MAETTQASPLAGQHLLIVLEKKGHVGANIREHFKVYREAGARLTLCFLTGDGSEYAPDDPDDTVIGLGLTERESKRNRIRTAWRLAAVLRQRQPDRIIADQYKCVASALLASAIVRFHGPIYALLRGYYATDSASRRRLYRLFRNRLTGIIALTQAQKDRFGANMPWYFPDRIHVVHNYIDTDALKASMLDRQTAREQLNLTADAFVFGCIARFDPYKRITDLLQAFAILLPESPDARLVIIGDGREGFALREEAIALGIDHHTLFTGFLPKANRLMRAFDVFVLPSEGDNFARVFLEAMAAELPVIGVEGGGTPEVIDVSDFLAPPRDPPALAALLARARRTDAFERQTCGKNLSRSASARFTEEKLKDQLLAVFRAGPA
ncbi:glycosyltransferase [Methylonatrum kenyense]|uniref:glycosyltransferase n=1 Tax=Methylonatrum kenyense TaxID=455253 RepID=UPI0020C18991|nr:glycosyltransferase [Methylonatrum kenyense]MCK8516998.1 glycosyltransferase [Methylonatrum kenyense]